MWTVVGDLGLLGNDLRVELSEMGLDFKGFNRSNLDLDLPAEDMANYFDSSKVVVNAVAFTNVDASEHESERANLVNGHYPGKLALAAAIAGAHFVHISTDYVFSGDASTPYSVADEPYPKTAYGASKLLGERLVAGATEDYTTFRTSWLYGKNGKCFPKAVAHKLSSGEGVQVVNDQVGSPTWSRDLAKLIISHDYSSKNHLVHATSQGSCSWFEFAKEIAWSMGLNADELVQPIASADLENAAPRPKYSVLDLSSTTNPIGNWRERWVASADEILGSTH
jgi:dTDP-4-dehydrorhamnose reductase